MNTSSALRTAAAVIATALLAACQTDSPGVTAPDSSPSFERSAQAQANQEAKFARSSPEVLDLPGTVFADNDERSGKLVFGVEHLGHVQAVRNKLKQLDIAESEYEVRLTPAIYNAATLRDKFNATQAGIQLNFGQYVCTLGFNVDVGTTKSFITNSHCTNTQGGVENTEYWQPLKSTFPTAIAVEVSDPLFLKNVPGCSKGKKCRVSDAARANYVSGTSTRGVIARTTGFNNGDLTVSTSTPTFEIISQDVDTRSFPAGTVVNKVGRTTGWTQGETTSTCVNTNVSGSTVQLLCQTFVQNPNGATVVSGGDSGSGVFTLNAAGQANLVGLLWGGSSDNKLFVFSPLSGVVKDLGSFNAVK